MDEHDFIENFRNISREEFSRIGTGLFENECGSEKDFLVWWSPKEEFPAFGIGHFIWLPENVSVPFVEQFPDLIKFYLTRKQAVPEIILGNINSGCPWKSRTELDSAPEKTEIIQWLLTTTYLQASFIISRGMDSIMDILNDNPKLKTPLQEISATPEGRFAIIDYLNFKGTGLDPSERYKNEGWGLLQVLDGITRYSVDGFADSALDVLTRRIENSPPERKETLFYQSWIKRLRTYGKYVF